jgi:hypothetical protein
MDELGSARQSSNFSWLPYRASRISRARDPDPRSLERLHLSLLLGIQRVQPGRLPGLPRELTPKPDQSAFHFPLIAVRARPTLRMGASAELRLRKVVGLGRIGTQGSRPLQPFPFRTHTTDNEPDVDLRRMPRRTVARNRQDSLNDLAAEATPASALYSFGRGHGSATDAAAKRSENDGTSVLTSRCGCVEELADYGCVTRNGCLGAQQRQRG